jgi:hypothetical protein
MSRRTGRAPARSADTVERRLARLLESAELARIVPRLAPEAVHQLIEHRGLDACEALISAATREQLATVLDLDLWRSPRPGMDAAFDTGRFGEWVNMLAAMDPGTAAATVAAMDPALVSVGLSWHVRVFDVAALSVARSTTDDGMETGGASPDGEVGGYAIFARRMDAWEPIMTVLSALAAEQADVFHTIMWQCRRVSDSDPEPDGLDDLLTAPAQLLHDVTLKREARRLEQGYMTPGDARAFLQLARRPPDSGDPMPADPIATAYFRVSDESAAAAAVKGSTLALASGSPLAPQSAVSDTFREVVELLAEAGLVPQQPRALLAGEDSKSPVAHIGRLMAFVLESSASSFATRSREVAFLANTLMAGSSLMSRSFTPREASDAVVAICNLGLERCPGSVLETFLVDHDLVMPFRRGWAVLHDVSLFVAEALIRTLADLHCIDVEVQHGLLTLRRALLAELKAGTPWRASEALEVLATLDVTAWASLVGLLGECPVIPEALRAILDRRAAPVSAAAFEFISISSQIEQVRAFVLELPRALRE